MSITPFSSRLRAATWDDHASAEQSTFLTDLTKGRLTVAAHTALTAQHYLIYEVLEEAAAAYQGPFHSAALTRLPSLAADLEHLAGPHWRELLVPTEATAEYVARLREIAFTWPGGFVAHHYNRYLGDLSGGQFVARAIAKAYSSPSTHQGCCSTPSPPSRISTRSRTPIARPWTTRHGMSSSAAALWTR